MSNPLMKCGCVAQGTCSGRNGVVFDPPVPACVIHDCIEVCESPDLSGRVARCAYKCGSERTSSLDLAFFEYLGDGSPESQNRCKCGFFWIAHQPRWRAKIKVIRRWFAHERYESVEKKEFHAPEELKSAGAERGADFFRSMMGEHHREETRVISVEIISIEQVQNPLKCKSFQAIGPQKFDKYYCGCEGWN